MGGRGAGGATAPLTVRGGARGRLVDRVGLGRGAEAPPRARGVLAGGGRGLNITVPFKQEAWSLAARRSDRALAARLADDLYKGRSFVWEARLERRIAALGADEVNAALRRHLDPARLSIVSAGDFR